MSKLNYEKTNKSHSLKKKGSFKSRKSDLAPIVKNPFFDKPSVKKSKKRIEKIPVCDSFSQLMTFGKYKNYHFKDIPTDYLKWIILNCDSKSKSAVASLNSATKELLKREPTLI